MVRVSFIKKSGQEMYFDRKQALKMIERENNEEHLIVSKIFEAILLTEFRNRKNLEIADLGAGAHPDRYSKFLDFLNKSRGKLFWIDQSSLMLYHASKKAPLRFKKLIEYKKQEMTSFLDKNKNRFDGLILKYSFNYLVPKNLENWMRIMYKSLKKGGMIIANLHFYQNGIRGRSFNAIYTVNGKRVLEHKPKDGDIIGVHFLKKPGDESSNPEIFASTKIVYYSPEFVKKTARKIGFSNTRVLKDWERNKKWKDLFRNLNPKLKTKAKTFLLLKK